MKSLKKLSIFLLFIVFNTYSQTIKFENVAFNQNVLDQIQIELNKYPKELLQNYLNEIIVQNFDNNVTGRAEAFSKRIRISTSSLNLKATIHHELSSVFLQRYDIYVERNTFNDLYNKFVILNQNFKYDDSITLRHIVENTNESNYFYKLTYAETGFENDFNVISQYLFTDGNNVINFMQSNPNKPVSKKIQLVLEFYYKLNQQFNLNYFKNLK